MADAAPPPDAATADAATADAATADAGAAKAAPMLGKYQPLRKLGAGGMGVVYLAKDTQLGRTVALKVLPKKADLPPNLVARFRSEARAAAKLHHPGIVTVYDTGETDQALFIALEFVDGKDVEQLLKSRERLPPKRATDLVRQIAEALAHLHEKGVVHRDIKPSNIMVRRDGSAVLTDLGLARAAEEEGDGGITRAGYTVGTVDYMSPEQAKSSRDADFRSDLYSLGCTWFHMLTGRIPFPAESLTAKLAAHARDPVPDPRSLHDDIPDSYTAVLQRAMAKEPRDRYATPAEFLEDLELAHRRRGAVSSDLLKDLAGSHEDDAAAAQLAAAERAAERAAAKRAAGEEEEADDEPAAPARRRRKRRGRPADGEADEDETAAAPTARTRRPAGEDDDRPEPRRRKPKSGEEKAYKAGVDPVLLRNALIGAGVLGLLIGLGVLAAKFSGAFGGPARVAERPKEAVPDEAPVAAAPEDPGPIATAVRDAADGPAAPPPADPSAAPVWVAALPTAAAGAEGTEIAVVSGVADPNPGDEPRAGSVAAALAALPKTGGTVTLRGPGPFALPPTALPEGAAVLLRGDPASETAPVLNALPHQADEGEPPAGWLRARGGSVTLAGLHVVLPETTGDGPTPALIDAVGATAAVRGGSVTSRGAGPAVVVRAAAGDDGPARVLFENAVFRGSALTAASLPAGPAELFAERCLLACGDGPALAVPAAPAEAAAVAAGPTVRFASLQTPNPAGRTARLVGCAGVFRRAAVVVVPGAGGPVAVTLAGCALGAAPGSDAAALLSPPSAPVAWTVENTKLAGLAVPDGLSVPGDSSSAADPWPGEPIDRFAALDPARFLPDGVRADMWSVPGAGASARAAAAARLPADPPPWAERFPDGATVRAGGTGADDVLTRTHPNGTTIVVTGGGRVRLDPVAVAGRSLRVVGEANAEGETPVLTAATGAGGSALFEVIGGRLELVNLTLENRPDRTAAGPLAAAEGSEALLILRRCALRAGADNAPAVRVRGGAAVVTRSLLTGDAGPGLLELAGGAASLSRCGFVSPGPAVTFGEGGGAAGLSRCALSVGGPAFGAADGADGTAVTERCLFLPAPPGGPGRVKLTGGAVTLWGAGNAFATVFDPPRTFREDAAGGGEFEPRTGPSAVVLDRPRVPDWKAAEPADLLPEPRSRAAADRLGPGPDSGPTAEASAAPTAGPKPATPATPRPARPGPNF